MKRIFKQDPPAAYRDWLVNDGQGVRYRGNETVIRSHCLKSLIREQRGICCYSGISILDEDAHIEHLYPYSESEKNGTHEDMDYGNMMACYPKTGGCRFGGMKKGQDIIEVTPFDSDCEDRFTFTLEGEIKTARDTDEPAERTIKTLGLDDGTLTDKRRSVISERLERRKLSDSQIQDLKEQMRRPDSDGNYAHFCFVIEKACDDALRIRAKRAQKRQHAARERRRNRR